MKKIILLTLVLACVFWVFLVFKNEKSEAPTTKNLDMPGAQITPVEEKQDKPSEILGYISDDQIGIFKIGASVPDKNLLSKAGYSVAETTYLAEGTPQKLYVVSKNGKQVLTFELSSSDTIFNISVKSSEFTTNKDTTIGSTISDFIKAYPNYKLWYTAEEGEKFILNTAKDAPTPQFFLAREDLIDSKKTFYNKEIKISDFKADAKITAIRVFYQP